MLRVLAVDDEEPALAELLYLLRDDPRVLSAEGATDATQALRRISRAVDATGGQTGAQSGTGTGGTGTGHPEDNAAALDVIFLDIHMPGLTGLDVARLLAGFADPPPVVFVTAHEGFAVQAFDLKAVDYVLKPVRRERLAEAVRRVAELRGASRPAGDQIPVELGGVTRFVDIDAITYAEAQGDYARLHTADGSHLVRIPLSTLEERWQDRGFVRVHRSHLVALHRIDELRLDAGSMSVRLGDVELAVSRRHAREVRDLLMRRTRRR